MKKFIIIIIVFWAYSIFSQGEGNNWYFGNYAGLSFSTNPPSVLNNGHLTTGEGCASVSGKDGVLVFYTDGSTVYDANHNIMANGTGLMGSPSSTQSAVICPKPGTYNYASQRYDGYFIVTIDVNAGANGVRFTEIDMTLNGGLGDVVVTNKNVHLFGTHTTEGAGIAKHANGCDYWIIGKEVGTTNVNAFHVSNTGVNTTPIVSSSLNVGSARFGSIKTSPNSKLISIVNNPSIEVFDFNNATGVLTTKFTNNIGANAYSTEFSPDNNVVYSTTLSDPNIYQYNLSLPNASIAASKQIIGTTANTIRYRMCGLQLAPNGKIYAALDGQARIGVIHNPNILGVGCNYDDAGVSIAGVNSFSGTNMSSVLGLPAFPSFFVTEPVRIRSSYLCYNDLTKFKLSDTTDMNNVDWFWGQTGSPLPTTPNSTAWEPTIQYANPGDYTVLSVAYYPCFTDSIYDTITITAVNDVNLGNDTVLCNGQSITLDAGAGYDYYKWHNGAVSQTFLADTTGQYTVEVSTIGDNLVVNGDFESGNTGFSSQYNFYSTGLAHGGYTVGPSTSYGWFASCPDHTNNSLTSNMMIVDAACGSNGVPGGVNLWCETLDVSPNTDYVVSLWVNNVNGASNPATIGFLFDGVQQGPTITTAPVTCQWNQYYSIWNSGTNTSVDVCINEQTFVCQGADFAIDDIFFAPLCATSDTINVLVGEIPVANFSLQDSCEYMQVNYSDLSTISSPESIASWSWDVDNDGTEDYTSQNPSHSFPAGTYTSKLTVTSANGCTKDTTMPVVVYPKPQANFTYTSECLYDSLAFADASTVSGGGIIASYGWNFGEQQIPLVQSISTTPYNTYSMSGTYSVTEIVATANGCLDTTVQQVEVYEIPQANFTYTSECLYDSLAFVDASTVSGGDVVASYGWNFGESILPFVQATLANPYNTYSASGTYTVTEIVATAHGCLDTTSQQVDVYEIPVAKFSVADSCEYMQVNYSDLSTISSPESIASWSWDVDNDGTEDYTSQNPSHSFPAGTYTSKLTVTSANGCTKDTTMPVVVYPKPQANFTYSSECLYDSLAFVDASTVSGGGIIASYGWNFGEQQTPLVQSTLSTPYNTYSMSGTYSVTEIVATANGCLDTTSQQVEVYEVPMANFTTANVCQDVATNFTDQSSINNGTIIGWNWDFGDLNYGSNQNESHGYFADGTYPIELVVTSDHNCRDTATGNVTIYPMPQVAFSMQNACLEDPIAFTDNSIINLPGAIATYVWDFGDQSAPSNVQNPTYVYQAPGTYAVTLVAISNENCSSNLEQSVTVHPLPQVSFVASEVCENEPPTVFTNTSVISSGSNVSYNWNFGDAGTTTSTQENPTLNYINHGDYTVTLQVTSDMGCVRSTTEPIQVKHKPTAIFTQDTTGGCAPLCVNFVSQSEDSIGISAWNWQFENGYGEGSNKYEGYCYENAGDYDVNLIVTNTVGCKDTVEAPGLISTYDFPIAAFSLTPENTSVTASEITFVNTSTDAVTWMWNFDDGNLDSVTYEPFHTYSDTGSYLVELTVYNANECSSTAYHQVIILPIENIFVPTAFSPNGDGENDVLYVRGYVNNMYFSVYDRWGKKVFESNDESIGWDGQIKGKPANEGVYMWYLHATVNGENKKFKGDVSLMR